MIEITESRIERFWARVAKGPGCWEWQGPLTSQGYGIWRHKGLRISVAYRAAYLFTYGELPPAPLELDHLCRNRACVRPDHLEPVTRRENLLRGQGFVADEVTRTHCPQGHPYDEANTYIEHKRYGLGRKCRACTFAALARFKARHPGYRPPGRRKTENVDSTHQGEA